MTRPWQSSSQRYDSPPNKESHEGKAIQEQIINAVKKMEAGRTALEVACEIGVCKNTIYGWKAKFRGMKSAIRDGQGRPENENPRLKQMVADVESG